jgi:hypothetical protein
MKQAYMESLFTLEGYCHMLVNEFDMLVGFVNVVLVHVGGRLW